MQKECIFMPFHINLKKIISLLLSCHYWESLPNVHFLKKCVMYYDNIFPLTSANFIWKKKKNCSMAINYWFYIKSCLWITSVVCSVSVTVLCFVCIIFLLSFNSLLQVPLSALLPASIFHSLLNSKKKSPQTDHGDLKSVNSSPRFCFISAGFLSHLCHAYRLKFFLNGIF